MAERALPLLRFTGGTSVQVALLLLLRRWSDPLMRDVLPVCCTTRNTAIRRLSPLGRPSRRLRATDVRCRSVAAAGDQWTTLLSVSSAQPFEGILYLSRFRFSRGCVRAHATTTTGAGRAALCRQRGSLSCASFWCCFVYLSELLVLLLLLLPSPRRFPFGSTIVSLSSSAICHHHDSTDDDAVAGRPSSRSPAGPTRFGRRGRRSVGRTGPPVLVHLP